MLNGDSHKYRSDNPLVGGPPALLRGKAIERQKFLASTTLAAINPMVAT
jgi:hypothetical protein